MKRFISFILVFAMVVGLVGCTKTRESGNDTNGTDSQVVSNDTEDTSEDEILEPLKVYCVGQGAGGQIMSTLLEWYKMQENAAEIEATAFNSAAELDQALEGNNQPDVIILDKYTGSSVLNPFQWVKEERLAGLNQYLAEDETYDAANYLNGVMEAGRYGDEQYMIPLSVSSQYLMTSEDEFEVGGLSDLVGEYTTKMLLETLIVDAQAHEDDDEYYSQLPYTFSVTNISQWLHEYLEQIGALHVDRKNKSVTVDEDLLKLGLQDFRYTYDKALPFFSGTANVSTMSYVDLDSVTTTFMSNRNMIYAARYMSSVCHQLLDQDAKIISYELPDGGYSVNVNVMGMVSAESDQPEAAVQFLRKLMDISHEQWEMVAMNHTIVALSPVNKNEALALIESYESLVGSQFKIQTSTVEREALTPELAEQLRNMIENNQQAFIADPDICNVLSTYLADYVDYQTNDLEGVAQKIKEGIEATL